ncbi:MAG: propanediol utilization protein [Arenibacterium sp.]
MTEEPRAPLVSGHFGEWLQGRMRAEGPLVLITLPCPVLTVRQSSGCGEPLVFDDRDLERFAQALGQNPSNWPALRSSIPPGCGAGASTATLVALARAIGFQGTHAELAKACIAVEGATDPLMFDAPDTLLWAAREARVVQRFTAPPRADVLGGYWGQPQRTEADDIDFPDVSDLVLRWRVASEKRDLVGLAEIATESAERCRVYRGPEDPLRDLMRDTGALGYARAHTGSARALIFAPGSVPENAAPMLTNAGLADVFTFQTGS